MTNTVTSTISRPIFGGVRVVNRPDPQNCARLDRLVYPVVNEFERNGMRIDKEHLRKVHAQALGEMEGLVTKVRDMTGESKLNLGSPDQLSNLLFNVLRLKNPGREKWTKNRSRLAADADVLKAMLACKPTPTCKEPAVVIRAILDWRERAKIASTYTLNLIEKCDESDRLHTEVSTTTTSTQRLASSGPNLQNIPIRTPLGRSIREAFIPGPGNRIGSVDASQIEMRVNAVDAQCANLLDCFWSWEDVYWQVAELTNRRRFTRAERESEDKCCGPGNGYTYKKWFRQNAKVTALMVGYDASAGGLYDQFLAYGIPGWTEDLCQHAIVDYFRGYPELLSRRKEHHRRAVRWLRVWDMWGFTRPIPQVRSVHKGVVNEGFRQAGNLAGQGGAAGIIKLWMAAIYEGYCLRWREAGVRLLMQVHDEVVAEGPEQVLRDFFEWCCWLLRNLMPYDVFNCPLEANYGVADNWGVADH